VTLTLLLTLGIAASAVRAQTASPSASGAEPTYTVTFADKRLLRLPPFALPAASKEITLRLALQVGGTPNGGRTVRVLTRGGAAASGLAVDATLTRDKDGRADDCRVVFGPAGGAYQANVQAARVSENTFRIALPARQGRSASEGTLVHPLAAQLFLGRQYDFGRGGAQTFALLLDWDGDSLNPAARLATLRLEADGTEVITLGENTVTARRLKFAVSGAPDVPEKKRAGVFYVGPRGELLQALPASPFGIPFDNGRATGPARADEDGAALVLRTTNGETIRGKRDGDDFDVELYGKPAYPFAVARVDAALRLSSVSETWNGRTRTALVAPGEVRYGFSESLLEEVTPQSGRAWFWPQWFATNVWEGADGAFAGMRMGEKRDGTYVPLLVSGGASWSAAFTLERLPDLRRAPAAPRVRHYRFTVGDEAEEKTNYDVYTDGARLIALFGSDGVSAIRDGQENFAASLKPSTPAATPRPTRPH
jgi:hypothetical protein